MKDNYDVVVVGAGPAGSAAAIAASSAGAKVLLVERGPFPGSKNVYGGVIYPGILERYIPDWQNEVPVERWITRRSTMLLSGDRSVTIDYDDPTWRTGRKNGATAYRADFDRWLASKAQKAGADLVCSTLVKGVTRDAKGRVTGVVTDRDGAEISGVVVAADGVNSFLAKEVGLYPNFKAEDLTLGAKEVYRLSKSRINSIFSVQSDCGVDIEILGATGAISGGGFLYTNSDTISIGVVLSLADLRNAKLRPEKIIADLRSHPSIEPFFAQSELVEYSAHLIPEAGYRSWPKLSIDGMVVAGDAASTCLATGIWLEGVNMAIGSGFVAGEFAASASKSDGPVNFKSYDRLLKASFVGKNHVRFQNAPHLVMSDSVQRGYPKLATEFLAGLLTVGDPVPKAGLGELLRKARKSSGISRWQLFQDLIAGWRTFR